MISSSPKIESSPRSTQQPEASRAHPPPSTPTYPRDAFQGHSGSQCRAALRKLRAASMNRIEPGLAVRTLEAIVKRFGRQSRRTKNICMYVYVTVLP